MSCADLTHTQHDLAVAADVSVDVIRKLEQGRRHTASIATLARIARALGVDLAELLGPSQPQSAVDEDRGRVFAIRDVLTGVDDLLGELDDAAAPDLTELARAVSYAWGHFYAGRFRPLAVLLPLSQMCNEWRLRRGAVLRWVRGWYAQHQITELPAAVATLPPIRIDGQSRPR